MYIYIYIYDEDDDDDKGVLMHYNQCFEDI